MSYLNHDDERMRAVLRDSRTIAVVGHSDKRHRTSYQIAAFLRRVGYDVVAVNPTVSTIDGNPSYASLSEVPRHVDIVNIFRRSEHVADIVDEALAIGADAIWTQLDVIDDEARVKALEAGCDFAMDLCIKVEHVRLGIPVKDAE